MSHPISGSQSERKIGRGRVADRIFDDLRQRILSGALANGSRLPAEKELAEQYGVSGATAREAIRVLSAVGLVSVRHGTGAFVTAEADTMIAASIASAVCLDSSSAADVLGVLGALNRYAAQLAVRVATDAEIASFRAATEKLAVIDDVDSTIEDLRAYMRRLSEISHNALLASLCGFFADLQVDLAFELSGGRLAEWRRVAGGLHPERLAIVEALESRSAERAAELVDAHAARAISLILSTSQAKKIQSADPGYAQLLAGLLTSKISVAER